MEESDEKRTTRETEYPEPMSSTDRLTVISLGIGIILAVTGGSFSTNARIDDLRADMNTRFADLRTDINTRFAEAAADMNARFAEAAAERRDEHRRIDERLDRLEDILLKPAQPADE